MRKILIFLMALLIGSAGAVPLFGPPQGFKNNGAVELGSLTIDGVDINGGSISYDDFVNQFVTNETAINSSIDALTLAASANETAINSSLAALTIAAYTNETAINASVAALTIAAYTNETAINATAANVALGQTAQNVTLANLALGQTAQNNTASNVALGQTYQNTTLANLALGQTAQNVSIANQGLADTWQNTTLSKMLSSSSSINASTSISTTLTAANLKTVFPMDGSAGHVTLTLPDAATNAGRVYTVVLATDMLANNVIVDTTGAGNLGGESGPDSLTTTDAAAALTVVSDGTNYLVINKDGTWS